MIQMPDQLPMWAEQDVTDPVSLQNNVLLPPPTYQQFGWTKGQFPPRNWFNWLARYTYRWIKYLAQIKAQTVTTTDATGTSTIFDVVNGGMCLIYIIDTGAFSTFFEGITYVPPAYTSGTTTFRSVASGGSTLTIGPINSTGGITVSGGTGNYVISGQTKTPGV